MINDTSFVLTLDHYRDIAPHTRHFTFLADRPVEFLPGQFITLHWLDNGNKIHRNYSLANENGYDATRPAQLELAASYVKQGFASERLFSMQKGAQLEATGPFGRLILRDEPVKRYLLIATGAGITPYRTMLATLADRLTSDPELHVLLLFGVRRTEDVLYRDEWLAFEAKHPRFTLQVYYSRETKTTYPYENIGYVTQAIDTHFKIMPEKDVAYLCGNPNMIDEMRLVLSEKGLTRERIRQERYISPKRK